MGFFGSLPIPDGIIVRPSFSAQEAESSNAIDLYVQAMDVNGGAVRAAVPLCVRVSDTYTPTGTNRGVIGAASELATLGAQDPEVGSILSGAASSTITGLTDTQGVLGVRVSYSGAKTFYLGCGSGFSTALVVGDYAAKVTFT